MTNSDKEVHPNVEKQNLVKVEIEKEPTMSGLDENIAGLLCYLFSIIGGIVFLVIEKENKFIRFHAMQAIFTFVVVVGISVILNIVPILGFIVSLLMTPFVFILSIFLMYQAYQGKMYKLPYIGDLAEQHSAPKQL